MDSAEKEPVDLRGPVPSYIPIEHAYYCHTSKKWVDQRQVYGRHTETRKERFDPIRTRWFDVRVPKAPLMSAPDAMSSQACTSACRTFETEDEPGLHRHVAETIWSLGEQFTKRSGLPAAGELRRLCTSVHEQGNAFEVLEYLWPRSKSSTEDARVWLVIDRVFSAIPDSPPESDFLWPMPRFPGRTSAERQTDVTDPFLLELFAKLGTDDARPSLCRESGFIGCNAENDDDNDAEAMEEVD